MPINKSFVLFIIIAITAISKIHSQTYVVWNPVTDGTGVTGTYPGGIVTVTMTGTGNSISFDSPAGPFMNENLVVPPGNLTFSTIGPDSNPPSRTTTFTFSTPIIITQFNMTDIDTGGSWNDSFVFTGITYASATSVNCTATTTGVSAYTDTSSSGEYASWFDSTVPVSSFTLDYIGNGSTTHAFLGYSLEVINANSTPTVTVDAATICSGNPALVTAIPGIPGSYNYSWTVPVGVPAPGNVASFTTTVEGVYSVIITNTLTGESSASDSDTVLIVTNVLPEFTPITAICEGQAFSLPSTSTNGITGVWSPAFDNMNSAIYTFTPAPGQCAVNTTMPVIVNPNVIPVFTQIAPVCAGSAVLPLPIISNNGVSGSWTPALNTTTTTTYTFTPAGLCEEAVLMTIIVNPNINPSFTPIAPICAGSPLAALPLVSNNGISGTWSPALNNTSTTTYTFTPLANQCAYSSNMTIIVNPILIPEFNLVEPICFGSTFSLPANSSNGVIGNWSPEFDNTLTTVYTFTPESDQCAISSTLIVPVLNDFDFEISGSCQDNHFILNLSSLDNTFIENSASYNWQNSDNMTIGSNDPELDVTAYINSTAVVETLPITFNVTVTNADGCEKVKPIIVENIYCGIQQGISANDDAMNDFFDLQLLNVRQLSIFNRYGVKVYTKANYLKEWTGETDGGQLLPDGTYYYLIEFNGEAAAKTGWIYLNRKG